MARTQTNIFLRVVLIGLVASAILIPGTPLAVLAGNEVIIIELEGPINPGTALYVVRVLK